MKCQKKCPRKLLSAEISLLFCSLSTFKKIKMSAKLSGAQNVLSASVSATFCKNWARAQIFWLSASASAVKFFERTKALLICIIEERYPRSIIGTPPFWHHRQLNMIRMIMRGTYSMDGPAWTNVTTETKDLIRRLLVVNPKDRLTVQEALDHEVFHAQRFTRVDGELLCIVHEDEIDNSQIVIIDETIDNDNNRSDAKINRRKSTKLMPFLSTKKLSRKRTSVVKVIENAKFNGRKLFKTAILCVRFLIRLRLVRTAPVLLSLEKTRVNPYQMRSYRKSIDVFAFGLYSHWIQKDGQNRDRAAVFQHSPKKDMKKKKKAGLIERSVTTA